MPGLRRDVLEADYGRRLVPTIIDQLAASDPDRMFASYPRSSDLAGGFIDVSFRALSNAINQASWWLAAAMKSTASSDTFAYLGPNDLRYPILLVAAIKCGYKMLLPSPRNSSEFQNFLLRETGCRNVFCARSALAKVTRSVEEEPNVRCSAAPELTDLLDCSRVIQYPYYKTYDEAKGDAFMILHTSGSTGPPKPITYTIECTTTEDAHQLLPDPFHRLWWRLFKKQRYFLGMPCYHSAGIWFALFIPLYYDAVVVYGPGDRPLTSSIADSIHRLANVDGGFYPPSVLEDICKSPPALGNIRNIKFMVYGGGPLSPSAGERLSRMVTLHNFIGFTEAGAPPRYIMDTKDWNYFEFHPASGFAAEHQYDDLYRIVFRRVDESPCVQCVFRVFPGLTEYSPGDVVSPHPTKPNVWRHRGRIDDLVVLSTGEKFNPTPTELALKGSPLVKDALVVGEGRFQASLLVEREVDQTAGMSDEDVLERLWPLVQQANENVPATQAKVIKPLVLIAPSGREFARSPKGTVQRKVTIERFRDDLNLLYSNAAPNGRARSGLASSPSLPDQGKRSSYSTPNSEPMPLRRSLTTPNGVTKPTTGTGPVHLASATNALDAVRDTVSRICNFYDLGDDSDLFELGMNSSQAIQIVNGLSALSSSWPQAAESGMERLYAHPTIRGLANEVKSHSVASYEQALSSDDNVQSTDFIESLVQKYSASLHTKARTTGSKLTVVLTGSTGSLGSYLLERLTRDPSVSKIICLNRAEDGASAQTSSNNRHGIGSYQALKSIQFLRIDLSRPDLALEPYQYTMLLKETDIIIHNAWQLDFLRKINAFEHQHIAGVRNLIHLASQSERNVRFVFVSSVASVFNWDASSGPVPGRIISSSGVAASNGYAQSKHVAERLLYEASKRDVLDATIVRVGQIAGPTISTGSWNSTDWVPMLIRTSKALGVLPKSLGLLDAIDWIPIDKLSDVFMDIIHHDILTQSPGRCHVYHAANPQTVSWGSLLPAICHLLGPDIKLVPYTEWLTKLESQTGRDADTEQFPAVKLLGWFRQMISVPGRRLPTLDLERTREASQTLAHLDPISGVCMESWMSAWGFHVE